MAEVEAQPVAAPSLTGYAEVTAAFQIVREVRKNSLKWQPEVLTTVLYEGTELARPVPRDGHVGENEILMKNVYYLGTKTKNVSDALVLSLVDAAVLTVEEGNLIMQQPTNKLRAVKMYALLVEKEDPDDSIITSVVTLLHAHDNVDALKVFVERFNVAPNLDVGNANGVEGRQEEEDVRRIDENNGAGEGAQGDAEEELENGQWACKFCTFINNAESNICDVCSKTIDFNLNDSLEVNICPQCTLMNENGADLCEACDFRFERQRPAENVEDPDDNDEGNDEVFNFRPGGNAVPNDGLVLGRNLINFD